MVKLQVPIQSRDVGARVFIFCPPIFPSFLLTPFPFLPSLPFFHSQLQLLRAAQHTPLYFHFFFPGKKKTPSNCCQPVTNMNFNTSDALIESAKEREERDANCVLQQFPGATGRMMVKLGIRTTVRGWILTKQIKKIARDYIQDSDVFASTADMRKDIPTVKAEKIRAAEHLIAVLEDIMPWIKPSPSSSDSTTIDWPEEPSYQIISHELSLYRAVRVRQQKTQGLIAKYEAQAKALEPFTGSFPATPKSGEASTGNGSENTDLGNGGGQIV
ncbi:unnamed protein product [Tuber aestivum]|uniref:Uncharacterized protein n=1 Tax=Tuber aestivum TaxID=59557 RepID=A0A292PZZ7_9PEZI|nr:unnamed protein product [Tuber aestivum]